MKFTNKALAGITACGSLAVLAMAPAGASAAFVAPNANQCDGAASVVGVGASFQRQAHLVWGTTLLAPDPGTPTAGDGFGNALLANGGCSAFAALGGPRVSYEPKGSGDGRTAFGATGGVRNTAYAFGGADEPHTAAQLTVANLGPNGVADTGGAGSVAPGNDDARLHTIPVAASSVAVVVNLPENCEVPQVNASRQLTKARLEGAFAGDSSYDTWGELLPAISEIDPDGDPCASEPVRRVVRFDSSGTTFAFKRYLQQANSGRGWSGLGNTVWPNDTGGTATVRSGTAGAGALLTTLSATSGGIGYADLGAARAHGYDWNGASDQTFWVRTERISDGGFASPAQDNAAGTSTTGANCEDVSYADASTGVLPASTTASWSNVDGTPTTSDYGICALTYALAWENPFKANVGRPGGSDLITMAEARSVTDYLRYAVKTAGGQGELARKGYSKLSSGVQALSVAGAGALTWDQ